ncbi:MAG: insulinase family protein [Bacteroidales bacterium]|nr:insulinase family protein [Bacteroidales bacterium]
MSKIIFERLLLTNGLTVLLHQDKNTPLAVVNILYKVGSRNENPQRTGFAHLFEHLMFSGSQNAPEYDSIVEQASGENNAFTNTDFTNYYINLPATNIETALWLEADRMFLLNINEKSLSTQRKVVVEEFKQRYLNKPYGDTSLLLRPLIYTQHPYQWPTIGKDPSHIEQATLDEVKKFYQKWYAPNNAILSIAGNFDVDNVKKMVVKWFEDIPKQYIQPLSLPKEPFKKSRTFLQVKRDVPASAIYIAFLMTNRQDPHYYAFDMISDILGNGKSSRLYQELVVKENIFQDITCYISGSLDQGFIIIEGKIHDHYTLEQAEAAIWKVIKKTRNSINQYELSKVKNKYETNYYSSLVNLMSRAENLAFYEFIGDAELINHEMEKYSNVSLEAIFNIFDSEMIIDKSIVLYYQKEKA